MATPSEIYNRNIIRARSSYANLLVQYEKAVADDLIALIRQLDILAETSTAPFDAARARLFSNQLRTLTSKFSASVAKRVGSGVQLSAVLATSAHTKAIEELRRLTGKALSISFADVPEDALTLMMARRGIGLEAGEAGFTAFFRTLMRANATQFAGQVDTWLQLSVVRGLSGRNVALGVAEWLARGTDDRVVSEIVGRFASENVKGLIGPRGGLTVAGRAARKAGTLPPSSALMKGRSLMRKALLIGRHEMNNAYHEADAVASARSPLISAVKWRTSGRHAGLHSSPDECDVIEQADYYGLGPGVYPYDAVPGLLHPRCMCQTSKVLRPPKDWDKPKPESPPPRAVELPRVREILEKARNQYSRSLPKGIEKSIGAKATNMVGYAAEAKSIANIQTGVGMLEAMRQASAKQAAGDAPDLTKVVSRERTPPGDPPKTHHVNTVADVEKSLKSVVGDAGYGQSPYRVRWKVYDDVADRADADLLTHRQAAKKILEGKYSEAEAWVYKGARGELGGPTSELHDHIRIGLKKKPASAPPSASTVPPKPNIAAWAEANHQRIWDEYLEQARKYLGDDFVDDFLKTHNPTDYDTNPFSLGSFASEIKTGQGKLWDHAMNQALAQAKQGSWGVKFSDDALRILEERLKYGDYANAVDTAAAIGHQATGTWTFSGQTKATLDLMYGSNVEKFYAAIGQGNAAVGREVAQIWHMASELQKQWIKASGLLPDEITVYRGMKVSAEIAEKVKKTGQIKLNLGTFFAQDWSVAQAYSTTNITRMAPGLDDVVLNFKLTLKLDDIAYFYGRESGLVAHGGRVANVEVF